MRSRERLTGVGDAVIVLHVGRIKGVDPRFTSFCEPTKPEELDSYSLHVPRVVRG